MNRMSALPALCVLALTACGSDFERGSSTAPDAFPSIERTLFGCPELNGVYAWPGAVVDGSPPRTDGIPQSFTLDPFRLANLEQADAVSFDNSIANSYYLVVARQIDQAEGGAKYFANIGSREMGIGTYRCRFGWLEYRPKNLSPEKDPELRIARAEDGGLIVAMRWIDSDGDLKYRYPEFYTPGGPSRGSVDIWRWQYLTRLGGSVEREDGTLVPHAN